MKRFILMVGVLFAASGPARASSWADSLFDELSRDFGSVPRGPILGHPFRLVNNTQQTVHISGVRASCGCTTARALQSTLVPGQETAIYVQMDTKRFSNIKTVTVFVTFDQPRFEEVRLWVQANSRDDVLIYPDTLAFGRVKRGVAPTASCNVSFLGQNPFEIVDVQCDSNYIQPTCRLVRQEGGEVGYQLSATMRADAPAGKWFTDVWLRTTHPAMPRIRVPLTVEIESAITLSPNIIYMGQLKLGSETDRKVVVRGVRPFRITGISGTDKQIDIRDTSPESQKNHVLTVTFRPNTAGEFRGTIRIHTDLKTSGEIEFVAQAQVVQ